MKKYFQILPERIYNEFDIIADLIRPEIIGFSEDCLKEAISIIAFNIQKSDGSAPIKKAYLKKYVPQGDKYLSGLIRLGIVIREGHFIPGEISYKYRFAPEYESKFITVPLNNAKLIRRIELAREGLRKESAKSIRSRSEQTKYLKMLCIDEGFKEYLDSAPLTRDQYNSILQSAYRIVNKDIFYSIDSTSGRFHSNVTNISKGIRQYLRVNGEPLTNIDVKNSQPYISTIILTDPSKVSFLIKNPAFALLLQTLKVSVNKADVKLYISLVITGQLYEYLMQEYSKEGLPLNRDETKKQVLRILFARNRTPKEETNRKARQIFKDRFPTVHRIFSKVRGHEKGDKFTNYKRFAILLQRIESYLMLDIILKRIYKELPGTIAVTVHDSIMTGVLTNNVEAVRKIMIDEFTFFVGFPPNIKIEEVREGKEEEKREEELLKQYDATTFVSLN